MVNVSVNLKTVIKAILIWTNPDTTTISKSMKVAIVFFVCLQSCICSDSCSIYAVQYVQITTVREVRNCNNRPWEYGYVYSKS